jgi:hypothetical protein
MIMVPTSSETDQQGNHKGTDYIPPYDECHVDLNISCVELAADLVTPSILEDCAIDLTVLCHQTIDIPTDLSAHLKQSWMT